jgi:hypothetical protein
VLPLAVGLTGEQYTDPEAFTDAFHRAMIITAITALGGALISAVFIRSDVLHPDTAETHPEPDLAQRDAPVHRHHLHCGVAGPPARPSTAARGG